MVNWKKWFLEEDEDEVFNEERTTKRKETSKVQERQKNKESENEDFDIEFSTEKEKTNKKHRYNEDEEEFIERKPRRRVSFYEEDVEYQKETTRRELEKNVEEIDLEKYTINDEFDLDFEDEQEELYNNEKTTQRKNGFFSRIKGLFSTKEESEEDFLEDELFEDEVLIEEDEAEDYKTYLERQKREEKQRLQNSNNKKKDDEEELLDEDDSYYEDEEKQGFFARLKDRLFGVSDEEIEKEELDTLLDDMDFEDTVEETVAKAKEERKVVAEEVKEEKIVEQETDEFEIEFDEVNLEEYEEKEEIKEDTTNLEDALKKLGVASTEIRDVDLFSDKSERRTHPTLAAVRTKRLKQDHKIDVLGKDVTLEKDATDLKKDVADTYKVKENITKEDIIRETKNKEAREEFTENFNRLERKEDKIEKDNPLRKKEDNLDEAFSEIKTKEEESYKKETRELEVRELDAEGERREKLRYTSVEDVLEGAEDLFEDDIDRVSKKLVGERFEEKEQATKEVEDFRKDLYSNEVTRKNIERTALDELIETEKVDVTPKQEETLPEIEELNSNLKKLQRDQKKETNGYKEEVDLVKEAARIEDVEIEEYDELKEVKKNRLEGYSDYHLDEDEIIELEEQNYLEENTDNVNIDSLLREVSPNTKSTSINNDVDKFVDEKVEPQEVAARRVAEVVPEIKEEADYEKEEQGIEYTEKLYTNDVGEFFDKGEGKKLGEYKTIDRGYRPVSKEKIENNQRILDAIFEKYSTSGISTKPTSVTTSMAQTNTLTPVKRSVGKFKPSPVYSSVYGSGARTNVEASTPKKVGISSTGLSINTSQEKKDTKKLEETKENNIPVSASKENEVRVPKNTTAENASIYKEIASQEETVWNIGSAKRVPKNKVKKSKK